MKDEARAVMLFLWVSRIFGYVKRYTKGEAFFLEVCR